MAKQFSWYNRGMLACGFGLSER